MLDNYSHNPVGFLLMASYAYYNLGGVSIMTDSDYDELCNYFYTNKDKFRSHPHFNLIPEEWGNMVQVA